MHICYLAKVHICYLLRNLEPIGVSPFCSVVMPLPQAVNKSANWLFVEKMTRTNVQSVNWLRNLSTNWLKRRRTKMKSVSFVEKDLNK